MLINLFNALFVAGLPMFFLSFALVSWALHDGKLAGETVTQLRGSIASLSKAHKGKGQQQKADPALRHWFRFGGGFYGLVALYTWLLIEADDLLEFFGGLANIVVNLDPGALLGLLIEIFVESLINFVAAIAWPSYWLSAWSSPWLLLAAAYAGYWLGIKAARRATQHPQLDASIKKILSPFRGRSREASYKDERPPK
ncbi:MAG: hypothetical protein ABJ084_14320 [Halioglobus sp.]